MSAPNPIPSLALVSDGSSVVTLSHAVPVAAPEVSGFRYFRSLVDANDAAAQAQADIDAGGMANPPGLLTDPNSVIIGGRTFSRGATTALVTYPDVPGSFGTVFYAVVVWNADGASTIFAGQVQHHQGPIMTGIHNSETKVWVEFDRDMLDLMGRPGTGFSFTVNGQPRYPDFADLLSDQRTIEFTMSGVIQDGDAVLVSLNGLQAGVASVADEARPPSFSNQPSENNSLHAALLTAVAAQNGIDQNVVLLTFSKPVTSLALASGLTFTVNGAAQVFTSIGNDQDPRRLKVTFESPFQYADAILFSYDASQGSWSSGYPIATMLNYPVTNASKLGTPASDYPLSSVVREQMTADQGAILATVTVDLNSTDQALIKRYGPAMVDFGGIFGVSTELPLGVLIPQQLVAIKPGLQVTQKFLVPGRPDLGAAAAADWQAQVTQRITSSLGRVRIYDQNTVLGQRTVRMV